jgi:hypothetical protein
VESVGITPAADLTSVLDALLAQISPKPDENDMVHWLPDKVRGLVSASNPAINCCKTRF